MILTRNTLVEEPTITTTKAEETIKAEKVVSEEMDLTIEEAEIIAEEINSIFDLKMVSIA